jgi:hypothetical protein
MTTPRSEPTPEQIIALSRAAVWGFEQACDCHVHGRGGVHLCAAHDWLTSDPTQRGRCKQWQRLVWVREQVSRGLYSDGPAPSPAPTPAQASPTILPW